jgi:hypothetical protein
MTPPRELPIAACRLDLPGLRAQRDRYREIGRHLTHLEREPGRLTAGLGDRVDRALVERTIEIERSCCEFFELRFDDRARELVVTVTDPEQDPALDAIAHAIAGH